MFFRVSLGFLGLSKTFRSFGAVKAFRAFGSLGFEVLSRALGSCLWKNLRDVGGFLGCPKP